MVPTRALHPRVKRRPQISSAQVAHRCAVTFYTNHTCPWAHRAHITLRELNLPYEEVIIPLDRPRDAWYLDINPRGLVPSIKISNGLMKDEIITESAIVSTFLADAFPSSAFYPASKEGPTSALTRARIAFFADTWTAKVNSFTYPILKAEGEEKDKLSADLVAAVEKEIEPLLNGIGPFFGGSRVMTLAEVRPFSCARRRTNWSDPFIGADSTIYTSISSMYRCWLDANEPCERS